MGAGKRSTFPTYILCRSVNGFILFLAGAGGLPGPVPEYSFLLELTCFVHDGVAYNAPFLGSNLVICLIRSDLVNLLCPDL